MTASRRLVVNKQRFYLSRLIRGAPQGFHGVDEAKRTFQVRRQPIPTLRKGEEMVLALTFGHFHGQALIFAGASATILWVKHGSYLGKTAIELTAATEQGSTHC
jgi:hypothetical protein